MMMAGKSRKITILLSVIAMVFSLQMGVSAQEKLEILPGKEPSAWAVESVEWSKIYGLAPEDMYKDYNSKVTKSELYSICVSFYEAATEQAIIPSDKKLERGHAYLAAILDWYSRKVLSWRLSNTMDTELVVSVTKSALEKYGRPQIFNSDLGSQYTSNEHIKLLSDNNIKISMNGKGRSIDNISIERFFRTVKYEEVLLKSYSDIRDARCNLDNYINRYNKFRLHSSLGYRTPDEVYFQGMLKEDTLLSETA